MLPIPSTKWKQYETDFCSVVNGRMVMTSFFITMRPFTTIIQHKCWYHHRCLCCSVDE